MPKGRDSKFFSTRIPQNKNCTPFPIFKNVSIKLKVKFCKTPANCFRTPSIATVVGLIQKPIRFVLFFTFNESVSKADSSPKSMDKNLGDLSWMKVQLPGEGVVGDKLLRVCRVLTAVDQHVNVIGIGADQELAK
jgi:hypothetical protein